MRARQLIRLYPRAWRQRYGAEFAELLGDRPLSGQQTIDILAGAVDAWVSPRVRSGVRAATESQGGGGTMVRELKVKCTSTAYRYTTRDSLIAAAVMILATIAILIAGRAANRAGYHLAGEMLKSLSFPATALLTMPLWLLKGQSWRVQAAVLGVPLAILIAISYLATRI